MEILICNPVPITGSILHCCYINILRGLTGVTGFTGYSTYGYTTEDDIKRVISPYLRRQDKPFDRKGSKSTSDPSFVRRFRRDQRISDTKPKVTVTIRKPKGGKKYSKDVIFIRSN